LGCHVTNVVTNGKAALSSVHDDPPDAILMDISLDGVMDGIETARQIKAWRDIPILFFTGYQDPHLLSRADAVKPVGIVDKLDTTENIQQAIVSLLQ
jgi:CheY-like chemotaxis protein